MARKICPRCGRFLGNNPGSVCPGCNYKLDTDENTAPRKYVSSKKLGKRHSTNNIDNPSTTMSDSAKSKDNNGSFNDEPFNDEPFEDEPFNNGENDEINSQSSLDDEPFSDEDPLDNQLGEEDTFNNEESEDEESMFNDEGSEDEEDTNNLSDDIVENDEENYYLEDETPEDYDSEDNSPDDIEAPDELLGLLEGGNPKKDSFKLNKKAKVVGESLAEDIAETESTDDDEEQPIFEEYDYSDSEGLVVNPDFDEDEDEESDEQNDITNNAQAPRQKKNKIKEINGKNVKSKFKQFFHKKPKNSVLNEVEEKEILPKYDEKGRYNPNFDHYYDDIAPLYKAEIERIPKETIIRFAFVGIMSVILVIVMAYRLV